MKETPIPSTNQTATEWQKIPVVETGEALVRINDFSSFAQLSARPQYFLLGIKEAIPDCYVRESVAEMLVSASEILPTNLQLVIWDAWRPVEVQQELFNRFLEELRSRYPSESESKLMERASVYVSLPSQSYDCPPPHSTGGAVDLTIATKTGEYLEMGTDFDDFSPRARTRCFENMTRDERKRLSRDSEILGNRRLLYSIMTSVGFTNYPEEWWHYDYGNQFWASLAGQATARYGRCTPIAAEPS